MQTETQQEQEQKRIQRKQHNLWGWTNGDPVLAAHIKEIAADVKKSAADDFSLEAFDFSLKALEGLTEAALEAKAQQIFPDSLLNKEAIKQLGVSGPARYFSQAKPYTIKVSAGTRAGTTNDIQGSAKAGLRGALLKHLENNDFDCALDFDSVQGKYQTTKNRLQAITTALFLKKNNHDILTYDHDLNPFLEYNSLDDANESIMATLSCFSPDGFIGLEDDSILLERQKMTLLPAVLRGKNDRKIVAGAFDSLCHPDTGLLLALLEKSKASDKNTLFRFAHAFAYVINHSADKANRELAHHHYAAIIKKIKSLNEVQAPLAAGALDDVSLSNSQKAMLEHPDRELTKEQSKQREISNRLDGAKKTLGFWSRFWNFIKSYLWSWRRDSHMDHHAGLCYGYVAQMARALIKQKDDTSEKPGLTIIKDKLRNGKGLQSTYSLKAFLLYQDQLRLYSKGGATNRSHIDTYLAGVSNVEMGTLILKSYNQGMALTESDIASCTFTGRERDKLLDHLRRLNISVVETVSRVNSNIECSDAQTYLTAFKKDKHEGEGSRLPDTVLTSLGYADHAVLFGRYRGQWLYWDSNGAELETEDEDAMETFLDQQFALNNLTTDSNEAALRRSGSLSAPPPLDSEALLPKTIGYGLFNLDPNGMITTPLHALLSEERSARVNR